MRSLIFLVLLFVFASNIAVAQEDDEDAAKVRPANCPKLEANTLFVSDKGKKGSAKKLTESHKNAESQGWNFDEMSLYTEDGDLEGFYVTYTRPHACNKQNGS